MISNYVFNAQVHRTESDRRPEPPSGERQQQAAEGREKEEAVVDAIYETMPESEREFGTLGVVRPPPVSSVKILRFFFKEMFTEHGSIRRNIVKFDSV